MEVSLDPEISKTLSEDILEILNAHKSLQILENGKVSETGVRYIKYL